MPQNSAEKKEKRSRDAINLPAQAGRVSMEGGFNPQEEANRLEMDKNMERQKIGGEGQEAGRDAINQPAQAGVEEGEEVNAESKEEKMTIPSEISAFVLQWEFIFALAGPFFLFILLVEFIALRVFSMFKFSKWKKICTLGNFFLACLTSLIYFLFFMMLMAALQKTGGTKTGIAWFGFKVLASNAWSGFTSFFGF